MNNNTQTQADLLELAGSILERTDDKDQSMQGLVEQTGFNQYNIAMGSGLNDYDYQNLSALSLGHKQLVQLQTTNKIPIPSEILEHFKHIKCHCMMGLFPEIGRAWLTIDTEIYIWTYEQARDVAYYDGISQIIMGVGLIKPKPNVFIDEVKYLLLLTTTTEIIILGVTFGDTTKTISSPVRNMQRTATFEEMQLMSKPIFVIPTDNISLNVIKGTECGRIFLGGRDGCLYEVLYQAESSWFGKRCKKINHSHSIVTSLMPNIFKYFTEVDPIKSIEIDESRKLLYMLSSKGAIEAWKFTTQNNSLKRIGTLSPTEISRVSNDVIKTVDASVFGSVTSICVLTNDDCHKLNLIAVTQAGVRLFYSITPLTYQTTGNFQATDNLNLQQQQQRLNASTNASNAANATAQNMLYPNECNQNAVAATLPVQAVEPPLGLYLIHVRLPPGYTPSTTIMKPKNVHKAFYSEGTVLLVTSPQQDQDVLWSVSSAPFLSRVGLTETTMLVQLDGVVWSLAGVHSRTEAKLNSVLRRYQKPRKVVLLTNQGAQIVELLKPTDILHQLLVACNGPQHEAIKGFFQAQSEREACVTCLLLAFSEERRGTDVALWAAQAFILYGGEPCLQPQTIMYQRNAYAHVDAQRNYLHAPTTAAVGGAATAADMNRNAPQMYMSTPMPNAANAAGMSSPINRTLQPLTGALQTSTYPLSPISNASHYETGAVLPTTAAEGSHMPIVYSAKHDGLYLYVARLLRPIWYKHCIDKNLNSSLSAADCSLILDDLYALKSFMETNSVSDLSYSMRSFDNQTILTNGYRSALQSQQQQQQQTTNNAQNNEHFNISDQAQAEEKRSLTALNYFIKHICEVIGLWKILCEHQFSQLMTRVGPAQLPVLQSCRFRDLALSRNDMCALLIVALINSYFEDNASVSSVSAKLRDICPNIYRHEDAVTFKATEILMASKCCQTEGERNDKLRTALQLCKDAAPHLPLQNICQQFTMAAFYEGVIELVATCAIKFDPEEFGIHFYQNNEPVEDRDGFSAFAARMNCYKEVRLMLDHVYENICNSNLNQELMPGSDSNDKIMQIVAKAVQIKDPLMHVAIYEWLLLHDMLTELLSLSEPSLGEFLRRNVVRNPENIKIIDLLWKYYEKNGRHAEAARILDNLASTQSEAIPLEQRIEYLARAVMCMRNESVGYSVSNGILLKELEDKLEISRVQKGIYDALSVLTNSYPQAQKAVDELNYSLYDITQLYQDFADPFNLWECKLTILNCSHHNDPLLIESVWTHIINKAVEGTGTALERSTRLFAKIESLVKEFGESGHCFPLAFILRELEIKACQLRLPEGIVPEKMLAMNLDIELLMDYYSRMISMNERVWANEGNEWHLVQSSIRLVTLLADTAHNIWHRCKRRIIGKAQDIVSVCLNLCYQKPGTEHLQRPLKELQIRLQRNLS